MQSWEVMFVKVFTAYCVSLVKGKDCKCCHVVDSVI